MVRRNPVTIELPDLWRRLFNVDLEPEGWLRVEEFRDGDDLVVRSELPGIDPDRDVELTVADGVLQIRARKEQRNEQRDENLIRSEFHYGVFVRNVPLPPGVKEEDIRATYRDGVLEIRVPMRNEEEEQEAVRRIAVERAEGNGQRADS
jgi:HSP20 family protein